jgi:hypothetical protein
MRRSIRTSVAARLSGLQGLESCNQDCNPDGFASIRIAETA